MPEDDGFAAPPFDPAAALQRLRRELRGLGLDEREGLFQRRGLAIARAALDGERLAVACVKRPVRGTPEWLPRLLTSSGELRDFTAELKRRLVQWSDRDD